MSDEPTEKKYNIIYQSEEVIIAMRDKSGEEE